MSILIRPKSALSIPARAIPKPSATGPPFFFRPLCGLTIFANFWKFAKKKVDYAAEKIWEKKLAPAERRGNFDDERKKRCGL
jgi:hypothetical protein